MRRAWPSLAASLLLAGAPAAAAVVREQKVAIDVRPDGSVRERVAWTVLVENAGDLARWSPYPILLDENRRLLRLQGSAQLPGGKVVPVQRKRRDRAGVGAEGVLHASQEVELVDFSTVPDGSQLTLEYEVEERPYFPSGLVPLGGEDPIESLHVEVRAPGLRVGLSAAPPELRLVETTGTAVVSGSVPAHREIELAPEEQATVLRYAWGTAADWSAVGAWYRDLVGQVPRGSTAVRALAERVAAGARGRQAVERLLAFVQRDVRYVAVEVGVGGYRPGAPEVVLERRWGDCKDKALLLIDLLAAMGIDARPALVHASETGDVEAAFPSPDQFNHLVVALPATALAAPSAAVASSRWVFVDATQSRGGLDWLHPWLAGHRALVITSAGGEMATIPLDSAAETERLVLDLAVGADGAATGKARLELAGGAAAALRRHVEAEAPEIVVASATQLLSGMLPGAGLGQIKVSASGEGVPQGRIEGAASLAGFIHGSGSDRSLLVPAEPATPKPSLLDGRTQPILLSAGTVEHEWRVAGPWSGCRLEPATMAFDNSLGAFRQEAALTGDSLVVRRRTELRAWQVPPERFGELQGLALAEHRALKRRLRLICPPS